MSLQDWAKKKGDDPRSVAKRALMALPPWKNGRVCHLFPLGDRDKYKDPHSEDEVKDAIADAPTKSVPIKSLVSVQHSVIPARVAQYVDDPKLAEKAGSSPPTVVRNGGVNYIWDGNHRTMAALLLGEKSIKARYADLDSKKSPK